MAKKDPILGAEGIVLFAEKLWPALQHVDSSSGALGTAVYNALETLVTFLIEAPADRKTRDKWLERLWQAIEDDGVEYLDRIEERWGEVCGSSEVSSNWADNFVERIRSVWSNPQSGSYVRGSSACLSCLLASGRYQELLDLLELHPYNFWSYRKYGVETLLAMGKKKEALEYAEQISHDPLQSIGRSHFRESKKRRAKPPTKFKLLIKTFLLFPLLSFF